MSNEHVAYPHGEDWESPEDEYDQNERLLWRNNEIRVTTKDLRLNVEALPENLANRARVLHLVDEILDLMPALDPEAEARDNRRRQELEESLKRNRQEWETRPK